MIRNKAHIVARSMHKKEPSAGAQLGVDPYFNFAVNKSTFCLKPAYFSQTLRLLLL